MADWPGNPVATMGVRCSIRSFSASAVTTFVENVPNTQNIPGGQIDWKVSVEFQRFDSMPQSAHFRVRLYRQSPPNSQDLLDTKESVLGIGSLDSGYFSDTLTVSATMTSTIQFYFIEIACDTSSIVPGLAATSGPIQKAFTAINAAPAGAFYLDFMPLSIVYCPPDQDMTASLENSVEYGTRMSIGTSEQLIGFPSSSYSGDLGVKVTSVGTPVSRSITNGATASIEVSYVSATLITADNQNALGRAYWGPLGDLFVIAIHMSFSVDWLDKNTLLYHNTDIEHLIVAPAYKLIRPGQDPVVGQIPADVRKSILGLDPFITNLDKFFPDSGAELSQAANPWADPRANNRAERLGRWWLDNGAELNYSMGSKRQLVSGDTNQIDFYPNMTVEAGGTVDLIKLIGIGQPTGNTVATSVSLQSSRETTAGSSVTASCHLIRNQNEKDLDAIVVYYDKVFSSLMFGRIPPLWARLWGTLYDPVKKFVSRAAVYLVGADGARFESVSDTAGRYDFAVERPGTYTLMAGDQSRQVRISAAYGIVNSVRADLTNVRRTIDLGKSPAWEVSAALGLSSEGTSRLTQYLAHIFDEEDLRHICSLPAAVMRDNLKSLNITWPATSLKSFSDLSSEELRNLRSADISSIQHFWRIAKDPVQSRSLPRKTGIASARLKELSHKAEAMRASVLGDTLLGPDRHPVPPKAIRR